MIKKFFGLVKLNIVRKTTAPTLPYAPAKPANFPVRSLRISGTAAKQAPVPACKNIEQPNAIKSKLQRGQEEFI